MGEFTPARETSAPTTDVRPLDTGAVRWGRCEKTGQRQKEGSKKSTEARRKKDS
jgi:hypothetical protein